MSQYNVISPNALFDNPIDLAIVMTNLPFHRTHQPEEPHNSVELEAMRLTLKYKLDREKLLFGTLNRFILIVVGVYIHTKGNPLGLPFILAGLNGIGVPIISPLSSPSKNDG
jgi:hypothetical protein